MTIPNQHAFVFDPTHAFDLDRLKALRPPPAPEGFDAFWQERYDRARQIDAAPILTDSALGHPRWNVFDVVYTSTDGVSIRGWLLRPKDGRIVRGLIVGHGYGGRDAPDFDLPVEDTAVLFPCFRGLSRSARAPISSDPAQHVLHDIDSRERYVIGGCVEDLWVAVSALEALHPEVAGRVGYSGISFGGGVGALAIPYDTRIARGFLEVPTFGNRPLWLTLPSTGSAGAVQTYARAHPEVAETLQYFDAAIAAARIRIPVLVAVARFDPSVAPPCQFTVANALPSSIHNETFILDAGHTDYPNAEVQRTTLDSKVGRFFRAA